MATTFAERAANTIRPPALSSATGYKNPVTQISVTNSAAETTLPVLSYPVTGTPTMPAQVTARPRQWYITVQNLSTSVNPAFVAFKTVTGAASVTTTTGWEIPVGQERHFAVSVDVTPFIECISAGTATLKVYCSSEGE